MKSDRKPFVSFNDTSLPITKRKVLFVKWLMSKHGKTLDEAKLAAHRKFGDSDPYWRFRED